MHLLVKTRYIQKCNHQYTEAHARTTQPIVTPEGSNDAVMPKEMHFGV